MTAPPIGRQNEYGLLDAANRNGGGALLIGPAGVGKTHLLRSFMASVESDGVRVEFFAACPATSEVRFGALARLMGADSAPRGDDLGQMVNQLAVALAADSPPAVMVDDVHLLDSASVAVLHQLATSARASLWLTARSGEQLPESVLGLWRAGHLARIDVEPLDREAADELAVDLLGGPASADLLAQLHQRTGGVPLYLRELIHDTVDSGAVEDSDGVRSLARPLKPGPRVTDLLRDRLDRLPDDERRLVEFVALAEPLPVDLLDEAEQSLIDSLTRRGALGYVDPTRRAYCRPGHPLLAEITDEATPRARRRLLLADLATRWSAAADRPAGVATRLGEWALLGEVDLSVDIIVAAGREALAGFEPERAEALARLAVRTASTGASHHLLGDVLQLSGEITEAEEQLSRASELSDDDERLVRISHSRSLLYAYQFGDPAEAVAVLQAAVPRLSTRQRQLELRSELTVVAALLGRFAETIDVSREILVTPDLDDATRSVTLGNLCYAQAMLLSLDGFDDHLAHAFGLLEDARLGDKPAEHDLLWAIKSSVMIERGDFVDGFGQLVDHIAGCRSTGRYHGIAAMVASHQMLSRGDRLGIEAARLSLDQLERMDPFSTTVLARSVGSLLASLDGDAGRAEELVEGLNVGDFPGDPRATAWVGRARAGLAAGSGELGEGARIAADAGREAVELSQVGWGVLALHDAARYGRAELTADLIVDAVAGSGAPFMELLGRNAAVSAAGDVAAVIETARAFAAMGAWLHAGEAWADAARLDPDPAGRCRSAAVAHALARQCSLRSWPLLATIEPPLSDREAEIAVAAATGASSKEIAADVFVSVRTVDNHLGRVYRTLGLGGRSELAELFAPALRPPEPDHGDVFAPDRAGSDDLDDSDEAGIRADE